ncbi:MAG: DUF4294 domain-containing protein [Chitinophagaceae bacterium]
MRFLLLVFFVIMYTDSIAQHPFYSKSDFVLENNQLPTFPKLGKTDTLLVPWVLYDGMEWMPYQKLSTINLHSKAGKASLEATKNRQRLINAILVTYPYAQYASQILQAIEDTLQTKKTQKEKRKYIKSREKYLKEKFEKSITNFSTYQGNILFKLINRETGNSCYEIIKMYKNGTTAFLWQRVGKLWGNDLKQVYDPQNNDQDWEIEQIVYQIQLHKRY